MRLSLTGGAVGWTTKTLAPRMFSMIWKDTSLSANLDNLALPRGTPRLLAMAAVSCGLQLPLNTLRDLSIPILMLFPEVSYPNRSRSIRTPTGERRFYVIGLRNVLGGDPGPYAPPATREYDRVSHNGWGGRIRTFECRFQRPVPYHLATPQLSPEGANRPALGLARFGLCRATANGLTRRLPFGNHTG